MKIDARSLPLLVLLVLAAAFPWFGEKYYVDLVMKVMILSVFALSLELLVGQTGLVSFGHAAFFGIGAYVAALLSPQSGPASFWILLPAAVAASGLYALAVGALSLRTRGIYFIMVTLAFRADGVLRVSRHEGRRRQRRHLFVFSSRDRDRRA